MKIVFSPSKNQKMAVSHNKCVLKSLPFNLETEFLMNQLKGYTESEISKILKISEKKSKEVWRIYNQDFQCFPAYELYTGVAYKALEKENIQKKRYNSVFVLSALYGVVPFDSEILPYRLDFSARMHLYQFWKSPMKTYFGEGEKILSLASQEFEKMIPKHCEITRVVFMKRVGGKLVKVNSVESKIARGTLLNYLLKNNCIVEQWVFSSFNLLGYEFSKESSSENEIVYIKAL